VRDLLDYAILHYHGGSRRTGLPEHLRRKAEGMSMAALYWFDRLATREIDPVLKSVMEESQARNPAYVVAVETGPISRTRCLLSITNRDVNKAVISGGLEFIEGTDGAVRVQQSYRWIDGTPRHIVTLPQADVTQAEIGRRAREFVAEFFRRVSEAQA
jgi:hypothetical protein